MSVNLDLQLNNRRTPSQDHRIPDFQEMSFQLSEGQRP